MAEEHRPIRGVPFNLLLEVENRTAYGRDLSIFLGSSLDVSVISPQAIRMTLDPGEARTVPVRVRVERGSPNIPPGEPSRQVSARIICGGSMLDLKSGFKDVPPLEISAEFPEYIPQGYRGLLHIGLRSPSRKNSIVFNLTDGSTGVRMLGRRTRYVGRTGATLKVEVSKPVAAKALELEIPYTIMIG